MAMPAGSRVRYIQLCDGRLEVDTLMLPCTRNRHRQTLARARTLIVFSHLTS